METNEPNEAVSTPLPLTGSSFKNGDVVEIVPPPPFMAKNYSNPLGVITDPEGIDARIFWSQDPRFKPGALIQGLDTADLVPMPHFGPEHVEALTMEEWDEEEEGDEPGPGLTVGGGRLLLPAKVGIAHAMGEEIKQALGEVPTPDSCAHAIELATAAQAFLAAMRPRPLWSTPAENLQRLAQQFGLGDDDDNVP